MSRHARMIKMPNGSYLEHQLLVARLNPDLPREVTLVFEADVVELSQIDRDNHFITLYVPTEMLQKIQQDEIH